MSDTEEKIFIWIVLERAWLNSQTMQPEKYLESAYGFSEREAYRLCQHTTEGWLPNCGFAPRYIPVRENDIIAIQETFSDSAIAEHKQFYGEL